MPDQWAMPCLHWAARETVCHLPPGFDSELHVKHPRSAVDHHDAALAHWLEHGDDDGGDETTAAGDRGRGASSPPPPLLLRVHEPAVGAVFQKGADGADVSVPLVVDVDLSAAARAVRALRGGGALELEVCLGCDVPGTTGGGCGGGDDDAAGDDGDDDDRFASSSAATSAAAHADCVAVMEAAYGCVPVADSHALEVSPLSRAPTAPLGSSKLTPLLPPRRLPPGSRRPFGRLPDRRRVVAARSLWRARARGRGS